MRRFVLSLAFLVLASASNAKDFNVVPSKFGNGYSIPPGSTITVADGEITDWEVFVDGPYPHTFARSCSLAPSPAFFACESPMLGFGDLYNFDDITITETEISIELGPAPHDQNWFGFVDWYECELVTCEAYVGWTSGRKLLEDTIVQNLDYSNFGFHGEGSNPDITDPEDFLFYASARLPLPIGKTVIATVVPETSGLYLLVIGLVLLRLKNSLATETPRIRWVSSACSTAGQDQTDAT